MLRPARSAFAFLVLRVAGTSAAGRAVAAALRTCVFGLLKRETKKKLKLSLKNKHKNKAELSLFLVQLVSNSLFFPSKGRNVTSFEQNSH